MTDAGKAAARDARRNYRRWGFRTIWMWHYKDWRPFPGFSGVNLTVDIRLLGLGGGFSVLTGLKWVAFELGHAYLFQVGAFIQGSTLEERSIAQTLGSERMYQKQGRVSITLLGYTARIAVEPNGDVFLYTFKGGVRSWRYRLSAPRLAHV